MIVDKKIELETKLLKDYAEWQFLSPNELNRKTIQNFIIFLDFLGTPTTVSLGLLSDIVVLSCIFMCPIYGARYLRNQFNIFSQIKAK